MSQTIGNQQKHHSDEDVPVYNRKLQRGIEHTAICMLTLQWYSKPHSRTHPAAAASRDCQNDWSPRGMAEWRYSLAVSTMVEWMVTCFCPSVEVYSPCRCFCWPASNNDFKGASSLTSAWSMSWPELHVSAKLISHGWTAPRNRRAIL